MRSCDQLGIDVVWDIDFVYPGANLSGLPGTVFVDIGLKTGGGIYDHHCDTNNFESSTEAVVACAHDVLLHLLGPLNETYYRGLRLDAKSLTFSFCTHAGPDWDGAAAFFLIDQLVRKGCLPDRESVNALVRATSLIDQGLAKIGDKPCRPFALYLMFMHHYRWNECLLQGSELIRWMLGSTPVNRHHANMFLDPFPVPVPKPWALLAGQLESDYALFLSDMQHTCEKVVYLSGDDAVSVQSTALIFNRPPKSVLCKYWVREHHAPGLLVVPYYSTDTDEITRFICSTDPRSGLSIPCLGYLLEQKENVKRKHSGMLRGGYPRFEKEYCDNEDPWYDGRGHHFTIVDSPRCGTVLSMDEIVGSIDELFGQPEVKRSVSGRLDAFISYRRKGGSQMAWTVKTMLESDRYRKKCFLDVDNLGQGRFDEQLENFLKKANNFIIILAPETLLRCTDETDWVRREIEMALALKKNIIPVIVEGFDFAAESAGIACLELLARQNAVNLQHEYLQAGIERVAAFMK